jgi:hypothetical protein
LRYLQQIEDWRRGAALAELAFYGVRRGATESEVEPYLKQALEIAGKAEDDWRQDRIRVMVAKTRAFLGQSEEASRLEQGVEASEQGKVVHATAMACPPDTFEEQIAVLEKLVAPGQFEVIQNVLVAYAEFFDRFYDNEQRRQLIVEKVKAAWEGVPILIRIELLMQLTDIALTHADQAGALEWVNEAQTMVESAQWPARFEVPLRAKLAQRRFLAGDQEAAQAQTRQAVDIYDAKEKTVANIDLAQMLRPVAEAYDAMGETALALDLYRRALEAGVENPNSRPRADDLAATCCSMAVHAVQPDAQLMQRIAQIRDGLGDPW